MTGQKPYFLTTAIDYVNNLPHIGTAYEKICADVLARFKRLEGGPVFFLMGNDEHSVNVKKEALARGLHPQAYCDRMAIQFREIWTKLGISCDCFIRTTDDCHAKAVTALFREIHRKGDIYLSRYSGLYCDSCEAFFREKELVEGKCPLHGTEPRRIEEDNYFFALSRYADRIEEHIRKGRILVLPEIRRNEILNIIRGGLEDISISRSSFDWGIPLPIEPNHVVYVWFDALINYISAAGYGWDQDRFNRTWPADLHIVGKDITRFHCIIWPAMLMSAGLEIPRLVFGHGFVYLKGEKMSKTLGNVVSPMELMNLFGPDALRYYLLRDTSFGKDGNFTYENFQERYNRDLANDLGNLLQRLVTMVHRYRQGILPPPHEETEADESLRKSCLGLYPAVRDFLNPLRGDIDFHLALTRIWDTIRLANQYIDHLAPWELFKQGDQDRLNTVIYYAAECLRMLGVVLSPFLPHTASALLRQLGEQEGPENLCLEALTQWGRLPAGSRVSTPIPLFPRIVESEGKPSASAPPTRSEDEPAAIEKTVSFEMFQSLELRAGRILDAERVPKTQKLLKLTVDTGQLRTLVAGIGKSYEPEDLKGRDVVVVTNLEPVRIRGILSEGMVLAAGSDDRVVLLGYAGPVEPGEKIR